MVGQMPAQWMVDRMCVGPFMVFLRKTVAGHGASVISDTSGFLTLGYDLSEEMMKPTCLDPVGDPPDLISVSCKDKLS